MKNLMKLTALLSAVIFAFPAVAEKHDNAGLYGGGTVGWIKYRNPQEGDIYKVDNTEIGFRLFGGYNFNEFFAAEAGVSHAKGFDGTRNLSPQETGCNDNNPNDPCTGKEDMRYLAFDVGMKIQYPITERIRPFVRVGLSRWDADFSGSGSLAGFPDEKGTDLMFGGGVQMRAFDKLDIRAEWNRVNISVKGTDVVDGVDTFSLSAVYRL